MQVLKGGAERLGCGILRESKVVRNAVGGRPGRSPVAAMKLADGGRIAPSGSFDTVLFRFLSHTTYYVPCNRLAVRIFSIFRGKRRDCTFPRLVRTHFCGSVRETG